ncbi:MAG: AbrB/MazE/SpoVT family DNA-binding domain-containing protein [Rhodocyclaceae bacterium]|jgi:antitoxin component of MazEF toxin-antitoxin module|nr:AbrB/MazE/SpoVT family DNA-binding domain-containing protein [Rhodocyclaceae bacterium]MDZ4216595.1 AbrB/MazE/SpoVT family DNA-binding domain-containing protein [Rhodocyclaceae bacterium]
MSTMILSGKRQVVLPADLCRQIALAPGARVQVDLAPDGSGILVRPATAAGKKPASVLFDRVSHRGKPPAIDELQGLTVARQFAKAGKS